jgi:hypothetical protein
MRILTVGEEEAMRLLTTLVFLVAVVLVVGWFRGWVTFTKHSDTADDKVQYGVTIDKEKAKRDKENLARKADDAIHGRDESKPETVTGTIGSIDANQRLVLKTGSKADLKLEVDQSTQIKVNERTSGLTDLHVGDEASVDYVAKNGKNVARSIAVVHKDGRAGPG